MPEWDFELEEFLGWLLGEYINIPNSLERLTKILNKVKNIWIFLCEKYLNVKIIII